jgi:oligopeptide/dipeptide ABC transporter ATP-binding protein
MLDGDWSSDVCSSDLTKGLLASLPSLSARQARLPSIRGNVPSLTEIPAGCPFHTRCPFAQGNRCDADAPPPLRDMGGGHLVACVRAEEIDGNQGTTDEHR